MTAVTAAKTRWTLEEYLARERDSVDKHEFFDGQIYLMAGASFEHNLVAAGLVAALVRGLEPGCVALTSDQRVRVSASYYTYPDATVVCGRPELTEESPPALRNPRVIFEVLSERTRVYDRGLKFSHYRALASVTDYVLLAQNQVLVEHYRRLPDGSWRLQELGPGGRLELGCATVSVDEVYALWTDRV